MLTYDTCCCSFIFTIFSFIIFVLFFIIKTLDRSQLMPYILCIALSNYIVIQPKLLFNICSSDIEYIKHIVGICLKGV